MREPSIGEGEVWDKLNRGNPLVKEFNREGNYAKLTNQGIIKLFGGGAEYAQWLKRLKAEGFLSEGNRPIEGGELPLPPGMGFKETGGVKLYFDRNVENGLGFVLRGYHHNADDLEEFLLELENGQSNPDLDKAA